MNFVEKLLSFHVVERENGRNFITWTYPTITDDQKAFLQQNCFAAHIEGYLCLRKQDIWYHINETPTHALVLLTKDFEPRKYRQLCDLLARRYAKSKEPVALVRLYLGLFTTGSCSVEENGILYSCDFKRYRPVTNIKGLIQAFDLGVVLIYNAILLKRRVVVYSSNVTELQNSLLAATDLVPCRNYLEYLYPFVDSPRQLKGLSFFVAGTNSLIFKKEEALYDLFVNVDSRNVDVSPKSRDIMTMTKTHKEIAVFLMKIASSDLDESEVRKEIDQKTNELMDRLKSMASPMPNSNIKMITTTHLKSKKFHPPLENFLFNLALAENMMLL